MPALHDEPVAALVLLNNIAAAGYLTGGLMNVQGGRWRRSLLDGVADVFTRLVADPAGSRRQLGLLFHLVPSLGEPALFSDSLTALIKASVARARGGRGALERDWQDGGAWNDSHLCASTLRCVAELAPLNAAVRAAAAEELLGSMQLVIDAWCWNREVLDVVATLIEQWSSDNR